MDNVLVLTHFCELHGPSVMLCTKAYGPEDINFPSEQIASVDCDGCNFEANASRGFVCVDHKTGIKYVTSNYPMTSFFNHVLVQQSCVRSLSCEVYPLGKEGML